MNVFLRFPVIDINDEIVLRQFTHDDAKNYLDYMSDKETNLFIADECVPKNLEESEKEMMYYINLFKYRKSIYWAIAKKSDNQLIGSIGFNYIHTFSFRAEVSYDLAKKFWNKKIMTKCLDSILSFGFISMNLERIEAIIVPTNVPSLKLVKKAGFKKEGILRKHKLLQGNFYDSMILSILKDEYISF